jgi:hypothetical protein
MRGGGNEEGLDLERTHVSTPVLLILTTNVSRLLLPARVSAFDSLHSYLSARKPFTAPLAVISHPLEFDNMSVYTPLTSFSSKRISPGSPS